MSTIWTILYGIEIVTEVIALAAFLAITLGSLAFLFDHGCIDSKDDPL